MEHETVIVEGTSKRTRGRAATGTARRKSVREINTRRILEATEPVFAVHGYAGASMSRLAEASGLAKANLFYYFGSKEGLYRAVLEGILGQWLDDAAVWIVEQRGPAEGLSGYIRAKMAMTRQRPHASRIFAAELLRGAPHIREYLTGELRERVTALSRVIAAWSANGSMEAIDPRHLLFDIWAMTQTYADFGTQICAVLDKRKLVETDFELATETIVRLVLKGCGVVTER
jgi:TetR/AcrR family transcriptional regulator